MESRARSPDSEIDGGVVENDGRGGFPPAIGAYALLLWFRFQFLEDFVFCSHRERPLEEQLAKLPELMYGRKFASALGAPCDIVFSVGASRPRFG